MSTHAVITAVLLLAAIVVAWQGLFLRAGDYPVPVRALTVPRAEVGHPVAPADHAIAPLVAVYAGAIEQDPFTEPVASARSLDTIRLPPPPPPILRMPSIPVLPLPVDR